MHAVVYSDVNTSHCQTLFKIKFIDGEKNAINSFALEVSLKLALPWR
jgi:hypothetical protein